MKKHVSLAECWLWLGVTALAFAGIYALVPVAGRTPQLKGLGIVQQLFDVALVVHVDLSVLIWFLSMLGMGVSLMMQLSPRWRFWLKASFGMTALATLLIVLSPLDSPWEPIKSNYIPVLDTPVFLLALGMLVSGLVVLLVPAVLAFASSVRLRGIGLSEWGWLTAAWIVLMALVAFYLSSEGVQPVQPGDDAAARHDFYEALFWAGGHVLQFAFAAIAMAAWLAVFERLGLAGPSRRWVLVGYFLTLLGAVASLGGFVQHPFDSGEFTYYQTRIMISLGGLGPTLVAGLLLKRLSSNATARNAYRSALVMSLILFFAGEALGLMIAGQNVTIPAHYHGVIVGITLALMGYAYAVLPRFGYPSVAETRLARLQPYVYGIGQLMHIGGLAYCGGYGVLRKTAGGFEGLPADIKIALGIFGLGGMLAISGGLLFVMVMLRVRRASSV